MDSDFRSRREKSVQLTTESKENTAKNAVENGANTPELKRKKRKFKISLPKLPKIKLPKIKLGKKAIRGIVGLLVVVVLAGAGYFAYYVLSAPIRITNIETQKSLSSRVEDAPAQQEFKEGEPIMLHFEYTNASVGMAIKFEVKDKDNNVVRSGSIVNIRPEEKDDNSGQRYASIVNTKSATLPVGKYSIVLSTNNRNLKTIRFEVVE